MSRSRILKREACLPDWLTCKVQLKWLMRDTIADLDSRISVREYTICQTRTTVEFNQPPEWRYESRDAQKEGERYLVPVIILVRHSTGFLSDLHTNVLKLLVNSMSLGTIEDQTLIYKYTSPWHHPSHSSHGTRTMAMVPKGKILIFPKFFCLLIQY